VSRAKRTDITAKLADDLTSVLDFLNRVISAADGLDGPAYMHDKSRELTRAADQLHRRLSDLSDPEPPFRWDANKRFDPARLRVLVSEGARHYVVGRALYPLGGDPAAAERRAALESAATDMRYGGMPAGLTPAQADAVAGWLLARAERETAT